MAMPPTILPTIHDRRAVWIVSLFLLAPAEAFATLTAAFANYTRLHQRQVFTQVVPARMPKFPIPML